MRVLILICLFSSVLFASDSLPLISYPDGVTVKTITVYNDMEYRIDTVHNAIGWWSSGKRWYVRTKSGEAWSDLVPIKIDNDTVKYIK